MSAMKESREKERQVFEEGRIGSARIRNRFVRSATGERLATNAGLATPPLAECIRELARGGVGLIISGHAYVDIESRSDARQTGAHDDATIPGLRAMAEAAHEYGSTAFLQLTFAGAKTELGAGPLPLKSSTSYTDADGREVLAMTHEEIAEMVQKFADAAGRAQAAGFDGVQLQLGHGYGLCQFVSPFLNGRTDEYGGPLENRARIVMDIYRAIRARVGGDYAVITKMNCEDHIDGGTEPEDMIQLAEMLAAEGLDGVEMSAGIGHPKARYGGARNYDPRDESEEAYHREAAKLFKSRLSIPLILVGGIRRLETAEKLISEGTADFISFCRPLLREPHLVARWQQGDEARTACISCNACFGIAADGNGARCAIEPAKPS